jgi:hypothetical protein
MYRPEFIKKDLMLIFREGKTKGIGKISRLVPTEEEMGMETSRQRRDAARARTAQLELEAAA